MTATRKQRILIVDDHPIFCLGMRELINNAGDLEVCGCEESAAGARKVIPRLKPDLVIVDISLKDSDGIALVHELKSTHEDLPVLVLSMYDESLYAERALLAGAGGYVMKQEAIATVVDAIRQVLAGDVYASEEIKKKVLRKLVSGHSGKRESPLDVLTDRELEVFRLIGDGLSTKQIADRLRLSVKTVGTHRENIKTKFQLKHYTELVKFAVLWIKDTEK